MKKSAITLCIATLFTFTHVSHANFVHYPIAHFSDDYHAMIKADGDTHKIHIYKAGQSQPQNLGIRITQNGKHTFLAGDKNSQIGSLKAVFDAIHRPKQENQVDF